MFSSIHILAGEKKVELYFLQNYHSLKKLSVEEILEKISWAIQCCWKCRASSIKLQEHKFESIQNVSWIAITNLVIKKKKLRVLMWSEFLFMLLLKEIANYFWPDSYFITLDTWNLFLNLRVCTHKYLHTCM